MRNLVEISRDPRVPLQYLTPQEEQALVKYVLRLADNGYPLPVKFLRSLALIIVRQRSSIFQITDADLEVRPPGKDWPQGIYRRHPQLKARRLRTIDWKRDGRHIEDKVRHWFDIIGRELADPAILPENVYNMDETGVLLSVLNSLNVLVSKDDSRKHRGTTVKRTLVTAIECISADGRFLHPLIIWSAATHRSYTNTEISLHWVEHVFDPQTRDRAGDQPRLLICDGFGTHESLEVMKFCFANRIILCRLPSQTSHKMQPCDVGVFSPLKTAYRAQVEQACRAGVGTIGKPHFTYLYDRARKEAFTPRNIRSAWSRSGLFPFDPSRVLRDCQASRSEIQTTIPVEPPTVSSNICHTPNTSDHFALLRSEVEQDTQNLDGVCKRRLQTLSRATEKVFAERALLLEENRILFEQNNEKICRQSSGLTVVGHAKVMSYEDIIEAQKKRDITVTEQATRKKRSKAGGKLLSRSEEKRKAEQEILYISPIRISL
ncbi:hypothetical protein PENCOP_c018G06625 [Penicillium coprophilum]|uniref:HTH CENPB-type domain-containing protein n=1 Tax=Penicillium coprophilum TaxID=36646 RepID=A0A1V6U7N0_9EURO|nr:hypothetical protein PENCOP_c018G06625 [Penicillium coprophilum]